MTSITAYGPRARRQERAESANSSAGPVSGTADSASGTTATGAHRALLVAALVAGLCAFTVAALGIGVRAADVGTAAVDEPQYLLTAISIAEDGDLDISDERAAGRDTEFHDGVLPVQTSVLDGGRRVSPHDPLLPLMLSPAMSLAGSVGLPGWVGAKLLLAALAGALAGATTWVLGTRWPVPPLWAGSVAAVAGMSAPLAVYGHQVYPELPAALAVVVSVAAIIPRRVGLTAQGSGRLGTSIGRSVLLVLAVSALPWLSVKYAPVAAALAVVAVLRIRRQSLRLAGGLVAALGASAVAWIGAHQALYGGWTAYATGDHFEETGEFSVVGVSPNYLARSTRLIGLWVDRDYGLTAWQPAWLLVFPAAGLLLALRRGRSTPKRKRRSRFGENSQELIGQGGFAAHRDVLLVPLAAGLLTATFLALTMHGFWWPGRQMVVVLPLAAMVVGIAGSWLQSQLRPPANRRFALTTLALGLSGVAIHAWTLTAGYAGALTWVGAANLTPPQPIAVIRGLLPDYRELGASDWALHFGWVSTTAALTLAGFVVGRRREAAAAATESSSATNHVTADPHTVKEALHR